MEISRRIVKRKNGWGDVLEVLYYENVRHDRNSTIALVREAEAIANTNDLATV